MRVAQVQGSKNVETAKIVDAQNQHPTVELVKLDGRSLLVCGANWCRCHGC